MRFEPFLDNLNKNNWKIPFFWFKMVKNIKKGKNTKKREKSKKPVNGS